MLSTFARPGLEPNVILQIIYISYSLIYLLLLLLIIIITIQQRLDTAKHVFVARHVYESELSIDSWMKHNFCNKRSIISLRH